MQTADCEGNSEEIGIPVDLGRDLFGCMGDLEAPFFVVGELPMVAVEY